MKHDHRHTACYRFQFAAAHNGDCRGLCREVRRLESLDPGALEQQDAEALIGYVVALEQRVVDLVTQLLLARFAATESPSTIPLTAPAPGAERRN